MIVADETEDNNSVKHMKALHDDRTAADKFQAFFSKIFGKKGEPFKNPSLFFYLSGLFTLLIIACCIAAPILIVRLIRRKKQKKSRTILE